MRVPIGQRPRPLGVRHHPIRVMLRGRLTCPRMRGNVAVDRKGSPHMSSVDVSSDSAAGSPPVKAGEMRLEVVVLPVSDVDRAKALLRVAGLAARRRPRRRRRLPGGAADASGLRLLDHLRRRGHVGRARLAARACSSRSTTSTRPAPTSSRAGSRSASCSTTRPGSSTTPGREGRVDGPAPEHADYGSFAAFSDPDGNGWLLQEIKTRLPGR